MELHVVVTAIAILTVLYLIQNRISFFINKQQSIAFIWRDIALGLIYFLGLLITLLIVIGGDMYTENKLNFYALSSGVLVFTLISFGSFTRFSQHEITVRLAFFQVAKYRMADFREVAVSFIPKDRNIQRPDFKIELLHAKSNKQMSFYTKDLTINAIKIMDESLDHRKIKFLPPSDTSFTVVKNQYGYEKWQQVIDSFKLPYTLPIA